MNKNDNILNLPFDQYSRQITAYKIIDSLRENGEKFEILDIGGYKGVTKKLQEQDNVTVLDVFDVVEDGYEKGDARKIKHSDESFDFVVSFDVLEHIEKNDRDAVLVEAARVAKKGVIFAAPVYSKNNVAAEDELNRLYQDFHDKEHPWLKEHIEYGIPESRVSIDQLEKEGLSVIVIGSNKLTSWVKMQSAIFMATKYPEAAEHLTELHNSYNSLGCDTSETVDGYYRQITIGLKNDKDTENANKVLSAQNLEDKHEDILIDMMIARYVESTMKKLKTNFEEQLHTSKELSAQRKKELEIINQLQSQKDNNRRLTRLIRKRKST